MFQVSKHPQLEPSTGGANSRIELNKTGLPQRADECLSGHRGPKVDSADDHELVDMPEIPLGKAFGKTSEKGHWIRPKIRTPAVEV